MAVTPFDPTQAVRFDLPRGAVRAGRSDDLALLVPAAALAELARSAPPEASAAFGRALGAAIGRRAGARLGDARSASLEDFVTQLAGEAAVAGLGVLTVERWGRALVVAFEGFPLGEAMLAPVVGAALEAATGRKTTCVVLSRSPALARLLVTSEAVASKVRGWLSSGVAWGDALARLQEGPR
jgi:hypothetical protein